MLPTKELTVFDSLNDEKTINIDDAELNRLFTKQVRAQTIRECRIFTRSLIAADDNGESDKDDTRRRRDCHCVVDLVASFEQRRDRARAVQSANFDDRRCCCANATARDRVGRRRRRRQR